MLSPSRIFRVSQAPFVMGLFLSQLAVVAQADGLVVVTEQLSLSAVRPVVELLVENTSAMETTAHFSVSSWRQQGDRDQLTPDRRLIVHPQSIKLPAGSSETIQVSLRLSGPQWDEEAFRVLVSETPPVPDMGTESAHSNGRRTIQRGSVPVFLLPPGKANPRMTWRFERNHDGAVILHANNNGKAHLRLNSAFLQGPGGQSIHKSRMTDYLLPGGSRSWVMAENATAGLWLLTVDTNEGPLRAELDLAPGLTAGDALTLGEQRGQSSPLQPGNGKKVVEF